MTKEMSFWIGTPPATCDLCGTAITKWFADAATTRGPWAHQCPTCHFFNGSPVGAGQGQVYELVKRGKNAGKWRKTRG